jgi:SAM-dependent methyltransferase
VTVDNRVYYDRMAEGYERERHRGYHAFLDESEVACVVDLVRGADVLEVGCGTGLILSRLEGVAGRLTGADLSPGMLSRASARGHAVVRADATRLPFADGTFDAVVSFKVLAHVPAVRSALAEMARVLRPGGVLAAEFYNRRSLRGLIKRLKPPTGIAEGVDDTDVYTRFDTADEAVAMLPPGFEVIAVHGIRIAVPAALAMRIPGVAQALTVTERLLARTPAARLGGFLVVVARKL